MTRDDELDMLARDTQDALADCVVTISANRPAGTIDPVTRLRVVDAGAPADTDVPAVSEDDIPGPDGDKRTRRRAWSVLAADITAAPSKHGTVAQAGETWRIVSVQRGIDGREYRIVGELLD